MSSSTEFCPSLLDHKLPDRFDPVHKDNFHQAFNPIVKKNKLLVLSKQDLLTFLFKTKALAQFIPKVSTIINAFQTMEYPNDLN